MHKWIMSVLCIIACGMAVVFTVDAIETHEEEVIGENDLVFYLKDFEFDQQEYVVPAGVEMNIRFKNVTGFHGVGIDGTGINLTSEDDEATFTFEAGQTYEVYCSIMCGVGHNDMVAKIVVEDAPAADGDTPSDEEEPLADEEAAA